MYKWWVLLHLAGVFLFLVSHGVSVGVLFRLRKERDPAKVATMLELSGSSVKGFYAGLVILLVGGFAAVASGSLWGKAWIWISLIVLVLASVAMTAMATPYYRRVGFVARALVGGTEAVTVEQFDEVLKDSRSNSVAAIGIAALAIILYMMVMKPTFGLGGGTSTPPPPGCQPPTCIAVTASGLKFDQSTLTAPAGTKFQIAFDNQDPDDHNVAIYDGSTNLFRGEIFGGPKSVTYDVPALPAGTYKFQCDVHTYMNGTFVVQSGASAPTTGATTATGGTTGGGTAPTSAATSGTSSGTSGATGSTSGTTTTPATSGASGTTATTTGG
ncbi:MAG TPA: cupredoxin domain-containing protein [Actinomycetota bacterium]|nr:cupredoxin domain-containing protein [Actinomycetota bacterium]